MKITSVDDIKKLGTIVSVWAHPDDETFSCAGIMAAAIDNGQSVACITATKGEAGVQDESRWPAAQLADIRAKEMEAALKIIGCSNHHWLGYSDGACSKVDTNQAVGTIKRILEQYQPDTVLTFGPDGFTGHSDHQTVSFWATTAAAQLGKKPRVFYAVQLQDTYDLFLKTADEKLDIFFNIDEPPLKTVSECDICIKLSGELCERKCAALAAMPSQTESMIAHFGDDVLKNAFSYETFVRTDL